MSVCRRSTCDGCIGGWNKLQIIEWFAAYKISELTNRDGDLQWTIECITLRVRVCVCVCMLPCVRVPTGKNSRQRSSSSGVGGPQSWLCWLQINRVALVILVIATTFMLRGEREKNCKDIHKTAFMANSLTLFGLPESESDSEIDWWHNEEWRMKIGVALLHEILTDISQALLQMAYTSPTRCHLLLLSRWIFSTQMDN